MYSVFRINCQGADKEARDMLLACVNTISEEKITSFDKEGDWISLCASSADNWQRHLLELLAKVELAKKVFRPLHEWILQRRIDILIEPEDLNGVAFKEYHLPKELLEVSIDNSIDIIITISGNE